MGPLGRWVPGIHFAVVSVTGPGDNRNFHIGMDELSGRVGKIGSDENRLARALRLRSLKYDHAQYQPQHQ